MKQPLDELKIGTTTRNFSPVGLRDAVHTAVMLVKSEAPYPMRAGEKIYILPGNVATKGWGKYAKWHGVVDPFIDGDVAHGDYFWAFLRPSLMEGVKLRHQFDTPAELSHLDVVSEDENEGDDDYDGCRGCY